MIFAKRGNTVWTLKTRSLALGARTLVMGVLNVTPDSFSDGGIHLEPARAIDHALSMFNDGADVVDIGGESTRPGKYQAATVEMELERVLPVIAGVLKSRPDSVLSIDTYHAQTATAAVRAGVEIVNDVSGLLWDEAMPGTLAQLGCGVVLMHTRGRPEEWKDQPRLLQADVLPLVRQELAERLETALVAGIRRESIVLDPGFGFGKSLDENYPLLPGIEELRRLGQPILAGVSRKSFLGETLADLNGGVRAPVEARGNASLAATVAAILAGADIVRVHDVKPTVEAARIADAILAAAMLASAS